MSQWHVILKCLYLASMTAKSHDQSSFGMPRESTFIHPASALPDSFLISHNSLIFSKWHNIGTLFWATVLLEDMVTILDLFEWMSHMLTCIWCSHRMPRGVLTFMRSGWQRGLRKHMWRQIVQQIDIISHSSMYFAKYVFTLTVCHEKHEYHTMGSNTLSATP